MGLFDAFKTDAGTTMTPHLAFAIALIYMMYADGEVDNEEVGQLLSVLGGKKKNNVIGVGENGRQLLESAKRYVKSHTMQQFIADTASLLSDAQKMCILVNLIDVSFADGEPESEEQTLFGKLLHAFGISETRFTPFFEVIALKNDRSVFTNPAHPKNALSHVELNY
ncbi:TerB family tellurite resistance protein [Beggiatoa leptomitoformis]|uniref:TerB family tellurite resistance protein n=1 Tax=Beggiatoa leptomitoformis TaxID=288004 RepID=A0A2N9YI63_9GAMM|nr:TerB family tellurite resistance protein [Beggiatoa leptomitoformis]ALG67593.1 TerB family tellurite resistance protein [Beggiatoa leptomitoformis]AUI70174.1 TerB family tellurite resistance protein [Beggiatoa leptomitoformis]